MPDDIAVLISTFNRPSALARSLPQIACLGAPILVMDDGSEYNCSLNNQEICIKYGAIYFRMPSNRGLAAAVNVGMSYWLADQRFQWISYFQDDVDVHPKLFTELEKAIVMYRGVLYTGHDSPAHRDVHVQDDIKIKGSCAGLHMHARRAFWQSILPIPTLALGAPKRLPRSNNGNNGNGRGIGSNVDWWIVRDSPNSPARRRERIVCLPHMVRTFLSRPEESCWNNDPKWGEDAPLRD